MSHNECSSYRPCRLSISSVHGNNVRTGGIDDSSAIIKFTATDSGVNIKSVASGIVNNGDTICNQYKEGNLFAVCPTKADGSYASNFKLDSSQWPNCASFYQPPAGQSGKGFGPITWTSMCGPSAGINDSAINQGLTTTGIYGDDNCENKPFCGLSFFFCPKDWSGNC